MFVFRRISPLLAAVFLLAAACREEKDPIRRTLDGIVEAAKKRDAERIVRNLTADFHDGEDEGVTAVAATLRRCFAAYESIDVKIRDLEISRAPESARAGFVADMSGRPRKIAGLDRFFPSAAAYRFDLRLVPETDGWKVTYAAWERIDGR